MEQILYPLIGISIIFLCTTLGALFVLIIRTNIVSKKLEKIFMGSAAGVMFSASFFSLLKPALETSVSYMPRGCRSHLYHPRSSFLVAYR